MEIEKQKQKQSNIMKTSCNCVIYVKDVATIIYIFIYLLIYIPENRTLKVDFYIKEFYEG